jgi:hypothetical protein
MTISANLNDKIAGCIIESTAVPGQPAVAVVNPDGSSVGGGGAVSSVFSRTGAVVAASGDYTVGQVTGAAPLAGLTATITGTTAGALYTSYKVSSGTFVFTLPVPVSGGWTTVTNCGSGVVTIAHNSTEVIFGLGLGSSGASSFALGTYGGTATLETDGTNWYVTAGNRDIGTVLSGNLGGNISLGTNTPVNIFYTASLPIGTWQIYMGAAVEGYSTIAAIEIHSMLGSATATLTGQLAAGVDIPGTSGTFTEASLSISFIAVVTVAGTLQLVGECSGTNGGNVLAATRCYTIGNATGYTAVKIG